MDSRVQSNPAKRVGHPVGGARRVGVMLRARADARYAEELEQLAADPCAIGGQEVVEILGHKRKSDSRTVGQSDSRTVGQRVGSFDSEPHSS